MRGAVPGARLLRQLTRLPRSLFVVAVLYAITVVTLAYFSLRISRTWTRYEVLDFDHWMLLKEVREPPPLPPGRAHATRCRSSMRWHPS